MAKLFKVRVFQSRVGDAFVEADDATEAERLARSRAERGAVHWLDGTIAALHIEELPDFNGGQAQE